MKNGYIGELELHKGTLEQALGAIPEDAEREATALDDVQALLNTLLDHISDYAASATMIQKVIVSWQIF